MISGLPYLLFLLALIIGIGGSVYSHNDSKQIFSGKVTSIGKVILNSLIYGVAGGAFLFAIIIAAAIADKNYHLSNLALLTSCFLSIVLALILSIASLWRYFIVGKIRDRFLRK